MKNFRYALASMAVLAVISFGLLAPTSTFASKGTLGTHPLIRVPGPQSAAKPKGSKISAQVYSTNWSGFAVTGTDVSDVVGSWINPQVSCQGSENNVVFWVGIDGWDSNTVEQTGTGVNCATGAYYAWYEFYPNPMYQISMTVSPGDTMYAQVAYFGSGEFTTTLTDETTGASYSTAATVTSACACSAEWITEAPSNSILGVLPLANYGTADYNLDYTGIQSGSAEINGVTGVISSFGSAVNQIDMVNSNNNVISLTSALTSDGTSFTITYQSGTSTTTTSTTSSTTTVPTTSTSTTPTTTTSTTTSSPTTTTTSTTTTSTTTVSTSTTTSSTSTSITTSTTTVTTTSTSTQPALHVTVTGVSSLYYYVFVSFTVTNSATGKPVSATVVGVLTVPSGQQYSGSLTTGSNGKGEFEIEALSGAGTYSFTMTASAKGYTSGSATVTFYVAGTAKHSHGIQSGVFAQ